MGNVWELTSTSMVFARSQPIISSDALQRRTTQAVQDLEESRNDRIRRLTKARAILTQAEDCTKQFLEAGGLDPTSSPSSISSLPLSIIAKAPAGLLESFVRTRVKKNLLEPWKAPSKGSVDKVELVDKVEQGLECRQSRGKFLIQLVKELASTAPIADPPHLPEVQLPTRVIQAPTVLTFKCSSGIESFSADRSWCLSAVSTIKSKSKPKLLMMLVF